MYPFRRKCLVFVMPLTAAMTLVASFPHFECRCPNGRLKPFCFGFCSPVSSCCSESCCHLQSATSPRANRHAAAKSSRKMCCCCRQEKRQSPRTHGHRFQVTRPGCAKTVAQPVSWTSSDVKTTVVKDRTCHEGALPSAFMLTAAPFRHWEHRSWREHLVGPPTDLVTLLQHYLI